MAHFIPRRLAPARSSDWAVKHHGTPCPYCGVKMMAPRRAEVTSCGDRYPSEDHVIPLSKGGTVVLVVCCGCNNEKGNMMPEDYLKWLPPERRTMVRKAMVGALAAEQEIKAAKETGKFSKTAFEEAFRRAGLPFPPIQATAETTEKNSGQPCADISPGV